VPRHFFNNFMDSCFDKTIRIKTKATAISVVGIVLSTQSLQTMTIKSSTEHVAVF
jgi:hypothetical protein